MRNKIILGLIMSLFLNYNIFAQEAPIQEEKPKPSLGLSVQPGGILIQHVKLGETYDLYEKSGIALIIENKDIRPHTYILTTFKPSQVGNKKWLKGYSEIPESGWFWFEKDEVRVEPQSRQEVKMYLKIPQEDKYYNQHWTVSLGVAGKPETGETLTLAVYPRYQIETEGRAGLKEKPDGLIGLEPSKVSFENLALGKKEEAKVIIYNNDEKVHKYKIIPQVVEVDSAREQIVASPGYSWIPNKKWIRPGKRRLKIKPGETGELIITVKIPQSEKYSGKKWEALIFVEDEEGLSGFVRMQIETNK
ncbi:hypothetical protein ACFL2J_02090 [Candidatus Omnitrophota bacterium]